ncbi:MAG: hypothetical protein HZB25_08165 [Candidatus Eisenbacteria bacterium]|nr:hypothetical protein [Candidatus Eisenbacteria bacterium]
MGQRVFRREFKPEAVRLVLERGVKVSQAARRCDAGILSLRGVFARPPEGSAVTTRFFCMLLAGLVCLALTARTLLAADGSWSLLVPDGSGPQARQGASAVYDSVTKQVLVFGGADAYLFTMLYNDVWALRLSGPGAPAWRQVVATGTVPAARSYHAAIWDPKRRRMIVSGGRLINQPQLDCWSLSLDDSTWTQLQPSMDPGERAEHVAIYDPVHDWMVIHGGTNPPDYRSRLDDAWAVDLSTLSGRMLSSGGPSSGLQTRSHTAIYDPIRQRLVAFGGSLGGQVWQTPVRDTLDWSQLLTSGTAPGYPTMASSAYDPIRDRILIFGGYKSGVQTNDIWALPLGHVPNWSLLAPRGIRPEPRAATAMVYIRGTDELVVYGGGFAFGLQASYGDTWRLSLAEPTAVIMANLIASTTDGGIRLGWSAFLDGPATFEVLRSGSPGGQYESVGGEIAAEPGRSEYSVTDRSVVPGKTYFYKIVGRQGGSRYFAGPVKVEVPPLSSGLRPANPNPMRTSTEVAFDLARSGPMDLAIYNLAGQRLRTLLRGPSGAGRGSVIWDGHDEAGRALPGGLYFARLVGGARSYSQRIVLIH